MARKGKEARPDEYYKSKIRELQSENKTLKQRVKQLERREHYFEEKDLEPDPCEVEITPQKNPCNECSKGFLVEINILDRIFHRCETCGWRGRARIVKSE